MSLSEQPEKTVQGALIQLFPGSGITGIANALPSIVQFDINPDELTRNYTPWKVDTENDIPAPGAGVQPITVPEEFSDIKIILDPYAVKNSAIPTNFLTVEARLAALRKMIEPSKGLLGDLISSFSDLANIEQDYTPPEIAPVILWLGTRIILPVQIESFTVTEHQHDRLYYPVRATVTLGLKVMTPDQFRCANSVVAEIAIAAYEYTRLQQDLSAIVSAADISPLWRLIAPI
jgi:hypothetical protein